MKKIFLVALVSFFILGCKTTAPISPKNPNIENKELNAKQQVYLNNLTKNAEYFRKVNDKIVLNLKFMGGLVDELEQAIVREKIQEFNRGVIEGKRVAQQELIEEGYVLLKIEDLKKLGLWKEEEK